MQELTIFLLILVLIFWALATISSRKKAPAPKALEGKQVAILIEEKYDERELYSIYTSLKKEGAAIKFIGIKGKEYKGSGYSEPGTSVNEENPGKYHGIIIPESGGLDQLRSSAEIIKFIQGVSEKGGMIAAIGHAVWVVISAKIVKDKNATCIPAIKDDLVNAGAKYVDESVVVDGKLITSRTPADLPDFISKISSVLS